MSVTDRDRQVAWRLYDRAGDEVDLADLESGIASYREELQAVHAREVEGLRAALNKIAAIDNPAAHNHMGMLCSHAMGLSNAIRYATAALAASGSGEAKR